MNSIIIIFQHKQNSGRTPLGKNIKYEILILAPSRFVSVRSVISSGDKRSRFRTAKSVSARERVKERRRERERSR